MKYPSRYPRPAIRGKPRSLADAGVLVVCGGGGGVPVIRSDAGELAGVEAVVDKDLTAAELAISAPVPTGAM